jgi:acyl-CoA thioester hydrolase
MILFLPKNRALYCSMEKYPIKLQLKLDWSEMDMFGHINNVSYFKYIQASRVNYWEQIGLDKLHGQIKIGPMLASTSCQFKKPLFYPGNIVVEASVVFMKTSSFGIRHRILDSSGKVAATADDIIVMYDFVSNKTIEIPQDMRKKVEQLEEKQF